MGRLCDRIPELHRYNCLISDQPEPTAWPGDRHCVVVSLGSGRFPEPFTAGGGALTLCEMSEVEITAWVWCNLDRTPDLSHTLLNATTGLWGYWQPAILRAMMVTENAAGELMAWDPVGPDGQKMLRNQIAPTQCGAPQADTSGQWMGVTVTIAADFDWWL